MTHEEKTGTKCLVYKVVRRHWLKKIKQLQWGGKPTGTYTPVLILSLLDKYSPDCRSEAQLEKFCIRYNIWISAPISFYSSKNILQMITKCNLLKYFLHMHRTVWGPSILLSTILRTIHVNISPKNFMKGLRVRVRVRVVSNQNCTVPANNMGKNHSKLRAKWKTFGFVNSNIQKKVEIIKHDILKHVSNK